MLSRDQARQIDDDAASRFGIPTILLMENAGRGAADVWQRLNLPSPVLICCGVGNNGGDGLVMARHLDLRGVSLVLAIFGDPARLPADARTNYEIVRRLGLPCVEFGEAIDRPRIAELIDAAGSVVDALLGTGARGAPRPALAAAIDQLNASGLPIVAIDVPSGLDADSGTPAPTTIRAAHTCTFVDLKQGFGNPEARDFTGAVHVVDIGIGRARFTT